MKTRSTLFEGGYLIFSLCSSRKTTGLGLPHLHCTLRLWMCPSSRISELTPASLLPMWQELLSNCHSAPTSRSQGCPESSGILPRALHVQWLVAGCSKGNPKANPPIPSTPEGEPCPHPPVCPNCKGKHDVTARACSFWRHHFDQGWIEAKYVEVCERHSKTMPLTHPHCLA